MRNVRSVLQSTRSARRLAAVLVVGGLVLSACGGSGNDDQTSDTDAGVRLNEIQMMGTHNSYRTRTPEALFTYLQETLPAVMAELDYGHRPLGEQFAQLGARHIELDVFADPEGGRYAQRDLNEPAGLPVEAPEPEMSAPGLKVLHTDGIDWASTCLTFVGCLTEVRDWSLANDTHLPMMILVEAKAPITNDAGPFTADDLATIDAEIRSVFDDDQVITPDDVRGDAVTLREAVTTTGWPTLAGSRGKVMFALDNGGAVRDAYIEGTPSLEGRMMFATMASTDAPGAAFFKENDPTGEKLARIQELVSQGFLVRTRSDSPGKEAVTNDLATLEAALASGAQFVSTDYLEPDPDLSSYVASLPNGGVARCNPVNAPTVCDSEDLRTDLAR
jgi:hypothetical protein